MVLNEIIAVDTSNNFITFEITHLAPITITKKYAGVNASLVARIKTQKLLLVLTLVSAM